MGQAGAQLAMPRQQSPLRPCQDLRVVSSDLSHAPVSLPGGSMQPSSRAHVCPSSGEGQTNTLLVCFCPNLSASVLALLALV